VRTDLPSPAYRITVTDFGYTGQRALAGLMDYHARWYDPGLARFGSAAHPAVLGGYQLYS